MITNYIPDTCKYSVNNLKKVVHIFSSSSNVIHIDNGEAYVTGGITDLQTISATSVTFEENTSYDDRFKFQKTITVTVDGFLKLPALNERYYVVLEDENKVKWLVNVDFPSLVTYTYTLADGTDETVFTFNALSNFPSLKLNANISNYIQCKQYNHTKVNELKMLEKKYANIDTQSGIIYGYSNKTYKTVKANEGSIKLEESFDGTNITTNIQFDINFDDYQSSWHYNLLEYPDNKYVAVIDHLASGFEMGLVPSYNIQGSHQIGTSDIVTIKLVGGSQRGSEWAENWTEVTVAPVYTWKLSKEWICYTPPPFEGKFKLTLNDGTVITKDCDATSAVSKSEVSSQYSGSVVSAVIGDCVVSISVQAFYQCTNLTNINIPNSVTSIGSSAFDNCKSLTSCTIPTGVTSIGREAFYRCSGLTSIDIPTGVTSISDYTFASCKSLTGVTIPDSITSIGESAFHSCTSLISITIPDSVTSIGEYAFFFCSRIQSITIPSGVTSIGDWAFSDCTGLTSVTVLATTPPTVEEYSFYHTNRCPIYVPAASVNAYKTASVWGLIASRIQAIPGT